MRMPCARMHACTWQVRRNVWSKPCFGGRGYYYGLICRYETNREETYSRDILSSLTSDPHNYNEIAWIILLDWEILGPEVTTAYVTPRRYERRLLAIYKRNSPAIRAYEMAY